MRTSHVFRRLATWWNGSRKQRARRQRHSSALQIESLDGRFLLTALTIAQENQLPGTPIDQWFYNSTASTNIQGYATQMSVDHGQTIQFKVNTDATAYHLDIYRLGYYGGDGARLITTIQPSLYVQQPSAIVDASAAHDSGSAGLVDAGNWLVTESWAVPQDATSGVYFAKLTRDDGVFGVNYIVFVVRNDEGNSDLLFKTSDETWQAYNNWGNSSLYGPGASSNGRSFKVSYNRPLVQAFGGPLDVFEQEASMIEFIESNGYNVSYVSAIDVAMQPGLLAHHQAFISVGHDEYWSGAERTNIENARDAGLSLVFASGNEMFWKTYWQNSIDGTNTPGRTLVCYKETHDDAVTDPENPTIWTGSWADARFSPPTDGGRPQNALTGTLFKVNYAGPVTTAITVPAAYGNLRFWRNTSIATLAPGTTATLSQGTLGGEWDEDLDNGFRPAGLIDMSSTTVDVPAYLNDGGSTYVPATATHSLTLYRAASGALVFAAGTDEWALGLSDNPFTDQDTPGKDVRMEQAMINLFADMGAQPTTLESGLVSATASTDFIAPTSTITSPSPGAFVQAGSAVTIRGSAQDGGGGVLASVEVSVDGGQTWHRATGLANWSYTWTPRPTGTFTIKSRAVDDSGNIERPSAGVTVKVALSLWNNDAVPATIDSGDTKATEIGVKFTSTAAGTITGLRFYKATANTGTHVGSVWTSSGQLLARATFTSETATGWQQVSFATPVTITPGTTYVASYSASAGHYSVSRSNFSAAFTNGVIQVPANGGAYRYGTGSFPTNTYQATNYWVDVVFSPSAAADTTPPAVASITPGAGSANVPTNATVSIRFSEPLLSSSLTSNTIYLRDVNHSVIPSSVAYNAATNTVTVTPAFLLANSVTYTVVVKGGVFGIQDFAGNTLAADFNSTFTTAAAGTSSASLWPSSVNPAVVDSGDAQAAELGVKFTASTSGYLTGLRFYKSTANTGTHTGTLWSATGQLLATATFTSETASGWQQVNFAAPVAITAGTTYVASYHTSAGHYSLSRSYFGSALTSGQLQVPVSGGVYLYGASNFPTSAYQASNYWIDVVFSTSRAPASQQGPDTTPPVVAAFNPVNGATTVSATIAPTITFSEAVDSSTVNANTVFLRDAANSLIPATVSYNSAANSVTLTPTSPLANSSRYSIVVRGGVTGVKDVAGNAMALNAISFFTTAANSASLWTTSTVPSVVDSGDSKAIELGVKFTSTTNGYITGLRFYKSSANTGLHTASLWTASGQRLATATFTNETASGWQQVNFATPIAITAGVTYVASYHTDVGHYAVTRSYFSTSFVSSPLSVLTGGGVYLYGAGAFPTTAYQSSNYWVDVLFSY